jgi:DNA-directed RNA polymerase subunit RPC12/RpoP
MSLLTVKVFATPTEAHLFKSRLENEGIDCYLFDENIAGMNITYDVALGGIKAKVNSIDTERVKEVLQKMEAEQRSKKMFIKCPVCESTEHYENFISVKAWKAIWAAILALLTFSYPVQKTRYKCKECDTEFEEGEFQKIEKL